MLGENKFHVLHMSESQRSDEVSPTLSTLLGGFLRTHPSVFYLYALFLLALPLEHIALPYLYGRVVDSLLHGRNLRTHMLWILGIHAIAHGTYTLSELEEARVFPSMISYLRDKVVRMLYKEQARDFQELETGRLLSVLLKFPITLYAYLEDWKTVILPESLVFLLVTAYLFSQDYVLGICSAVMALVAVGIIVLGPILCQTTAMQRDAHFNQMQEDLEEVFRNMMSILNADSFEQENDRMDQLVQQYRLASKKVIHRQVSVKFVLAIAEMIFLIGFVYRAYKLLRAKKISTGTFMTFFFLATTIQSSLDKVILYMKDLIHRWGTLQESVRTLRQMLPSASESAPAPPTQVAVAGEPTPGTVLSVRGLSYQYARGGGSWTLQDVTMDIHPGERVAFIGTIGSGKSTLLRLLLRYHPLRYGEIYLQGRPYRELEAHEIRRHMALVPQSAILFDRTIYENITYGIVPAPSEERVLEMIRELDLESILLAFAEGLHARVGKNGSRLSGGQRQVVWILRAILQNPAILLLDEPTASIDAKTKEAIQRLLERATQGRTVLMVTHDPFLMRQATRHIRFHRGRIMSDQQRK